uniref:C2H2-type domain-containing protein n=1 Tax=Oryza meridionalis TaxID=40149 RepID=A0A0E0F6X2_9ORYZ
MAGVGRSRDRRKEGKRASISKDPREEDAKSNPRIEAGDVLQIYRNGDLDTALSQCLEITTTKYKLSPPPLLSNLLGYLGMKAFLFAGEVQPELAERCAKVALESYGKATEYVPNCIETAASYGEAMSALKLYRSAEIELNRAMSIARPLDPAIHNILYGVGIPDKSTKNHRIAAAKEKLHRAIDINRNSICADSITDVLNIIGSEGPLSAVQSATTVATCFPHSARAQYLPAYVALKVAQGLRPDIDNTEILHCALSIMDKAANDFGCSLVIALFRAKLMVVFGDYGAAESECYRALCIDQPDDPKAHEIPFGSIKGEEYDDRICSVKRQIHRLLQSIVLFATRDWSLMTCETQGTIWSVRADVLRQHYHSISHALSEVISNAQNLIRAVEIQKNNQKEGNEIIKTIKKKLRSLPSDRSSNEVWHLYIIGFSLAFLPKFSLSSKKIQEMCSTLAKKSSFDYREIILPLTRSYQWLGLSHLVSEVLAEDANAMVNRKPSDITSIGEEDIGMKLSATLELKEKDVQFSDEVAGTSSYQMDSVQTFEPSLYKPPPDPPTISRQAIRYGYNALHKPAVGPNATTPINRLIEIVNEVNNFDPYKMELSHESYRRELAKIPKDQELCAACFFERFSIVTMTSGKTIHHYQTLHHTVGLKCNMCNARFIKDSDLDYHNRYHHQQQQQQ